MSKVFVKLLDQKARTIARATKGSVGYDLYSIEEKIIKPWSRDSIRTGISLEIQEENLYARILPRSSLSLKNGILIGAGVIDRDYRGEILVVLFNMNDEEFLVTPDRPIAQIVFEKISLPEVVLTEKLSSTERDTGGFGSTDKV